ncbi:MAG: GNAT family N-acetyltransferase [Actinomycetota bacterium]|nr:GNAT family N-acetyltransferase [Actinomycetota bacterium]
MLARVLHTPRLRLEAVTPEHAEGLWNAIERSLPELRRFMAWAPSASLENSRVFTQMMARRWEEVSEWTFVIVHDGEAAGTISLSGYQSLFALAEIGYWLRSDLSGRGLMTEAARAVSDFGFDEIGLHRIELRAAVDNAGSIRIAEKLGFAREGLLREASWSERGYLDLYIYGLLAEERPAL